MDPHSKVVHDRDEEVMRTMHHIKETNGVLCWKFYPYHSDGLVFTIRLIYVFFFVALIFMIGEKRCLAFSYHN